MGSRAASCRQVFQFQRNIPVLIGDQQLWIAARPNLDLGLPGSLRSRC
jgi:hypothetical protein